MPRTKLTAEDVVHIRMDPRKQVDIAAQYGVSPSTISVIRNGLAWKHIVSKHTTARRRRAKLKREDIEYIRKNPTGLSQAELSRIYKVSQPTISHVVNQRTWRRFYP